MSKELKVTEEMIEIINSLVRKGYSDVCWSWCSK